MIVLVESGNIGDAFCAAPAVKLLALEREALGKPPIHVAWKAPGVEELCMPAIPHAKPLWLTNKGGHPRQTHEVVKLDLDFLHHKNQHPTGYFARLAGFNVNEPLDIPIHVPEDQWTDADFDYLIAPFTLDMVQRGTDLALWRNVVAALRQTRPGCRIGVIFGPDERHVPTMDVFGDMPGRGAVLRERPFPELVATMRRTKGAVITIDSCMNRLAHAAGIDNHVLVLSNVVPIVWGSHPKAIVVYGAPSAWTVDAILERVKIAEERHAVLR